MEPDLNFSLIPLLVAFADPKKNSTLGIIQQLWSIEEWDNHMGSIFIGRF